MNYYPPKNKDFTLPPGQLPALLVKIHGGEDTFEYARIVETA
jgi:hypothetical protein